MDPIWIGVCGIGVMIVGLLASVPVAAALGIVSLVGMATIAGWQGALGMIAVASFNEATSYDFAAVALYIAIGAIAIECGMADFLFDALTKWFSRVRGGLMIATTMAAAFFGACSGSSIASCALFGKLAVPKMIKGGYDPSLATGCVAASGTLAVLIPPSGMLILYGILTQQSIGHLFMAGLLPGIINALLYCFGMYGISVIKPHLVPPSESFSLSERLSASRKAWPAPVIGIFIILSLYFGIATPTEIAGVGAFFCIVTAVAFTGLRGARLPQAMVETARQSAMILLIVIGAKMFGRFLAVSQVAPWLVNAIEATGLSKGWVMFLLIVMYGIMGCIVDALAMAVVSIPIVFPLVTALGFDPIWFGVILVQMVEIAVMTPPMGMNVFVTKSVVGDLASFGQVFRGTCIFLTADIILLALMLLFPQIVLFLPGRM
ncbi:MAG: TRAP transporter large permease [Deltaproteobacteria bacterium]|nr:TRAP transporter large permease [Deltaproteobacteria bacterium]